MVVPDWRRFGGRRPKPLLCLGWKRSTLLPAFLPRTAHRDRQRALALLRSLLATAILGCIAIFAYSRRHPITWKSRLLAYIYVPEPRPPLYEEWREAEWYLPQHSALDPFANGKKYLWVSSHVYWAGWGNFMQDMLLTAHLTYLSGRAHVFDDYTWDEDGPLYSRFNNEKWIPNRIPLTAIMSGPIVGDNFPPGDPTPKAVSKQYFDKICRKRKVIDADRMYKMYTGGESALEVIEKWLNILGKIDDPCVEIRARPGRPMFHVYMFGYRDAVLSIWPSLSKSPVLTHFGWSSLAHDGFDTNRDLFSPAPLAPPQPEDPYSRLDGLLALHLRRGDFLEHCANLAHWGANFNGFNQFSEFPDPWRRPVEASPEETMSLYLRRCIPDIDQILEKVERVRSSSVGDGLKSIYIMTNGDVAWLDELKAALLWVYPWERIATSRDMVLTWEEKFVAQSMDMLIGERAQAFIGNGFSSLSSNIVLRRMAKAFPGNSTTMW